MQAIGQQSVHAVLWLSSREHGRELIVLKPQFFHETNVCRKNNSP